MLLPETDASRAVLDEGGGRGTVGWVGRLRGGEGEVRPGRSVDVAGSRM